MSTCQNCGRDFPGGNYPLYCGCGHVTGSSAELRFDLAGPNAWRVWHERCAAAIKSGEWDPELESKWHANEWSKMIPSAGCDCRGHWSKLLEEWGGIDFTTAETAFRDAWFYHREVSKLPEVSRPLMTLEQARFLYLDEPPVCDRCIVTVATGQKFRELLNVSRPSLVRYAERCNADYYELTDARFADWKLEKFRTHHFATRYARTLFIDADVWIRPSCPDLFEVVAPNAVGFHDDFPKMHNPSWLDAEFRRVAASQNVAICGSTSCLNSGIVMCSKESADIWKPPTKPLPNRHIAEQCWVEMQAAPFALQKLPAAFNCQWWFPDFADLAKDAFIIHLAACASKLLTLRNFAAAD